MGSNNEGSLTTGLSPTHHGCLSLVSKPHKNSYFPWDEIVFHRITVSKSFYFSLTGFAASAIYTHIAYCTILMRWWIFDSSSIFFSLSIFLFFFFLFFFNCYGTYVCFCGDHTSLSLWESFKRMLKKNLSNRSCSSARHLSICDLKEHCLSVK